MTSLANVNISDIALNSTPDNNGSLTPPQPESMRSVLKQASKDNWVSVISFIVFLLAWEGICFFELVGEYQLVPPSELIITFIDKLTEASPDGAVLGDHIITSLSLAVIGFICAVVFGVPLGLLMGWYAPVRRAVRPIFDVLRPIPPIAWIPLAIIWLGIGVPAKAFIILIAAFVPSVINSYTGIRMTNPVLIRVSQIYGNSNWTTFIKIGIPSAIPMVFTGLKISLNAAWTTLVAAELLASSDGLGYLIQIGRRLMRPDLIIVGMLTIGFLGALLSTVLTKVESKIASSTQGGAGNVSTGIPENTKGILNHLYPYLPFFGLLIIWQLVSMQRGGQDLPYPIAVVDRAILMFSEPIGGRTIWEHIGFSMFRVLSAFIIAISIGIPFGLYRGWNPTFDKIVKPIFELLRPIPPIAWIPLAILWLGIGEGPKIFICFVASFVISVLNSYTGMRYVDQGLLNAAKSFGANPWQQFRSVAVPACMPSIFAGLQNALSVSWMGVLAAEMVNAREGVGYLIDQSMQLSLPDMTIVGMAIIGIVGALLSYFLRFVEKSLCPWRGHLV